MYRETVTLFWSVTLKGGHDVNDQLHVTLLFVLLCTLLTLQLRHLCNLWVNSCKSEFVGSANWCILFCDHKSQLINFFIIVLSRAFEIEKAVSICLYDPVFFIGYILHKAILSLTCGPILLTGTSDLSFAEQVTMSKNVWNFIYCNLNWYFILYSFLRWLLLWYC